MLPIAWLWLKAALLVAGLLIPGAAIARAARLPPTAANCFAGSALSLYVTVIVLQLANVPIALGSLALGLGIVTLIATLLRYLQPGDGSPASSPDSATGWFEPLARMGVWTPLYAAFWCIVIWRCVHQPLAGPDVEFRWNFLAEQMLARGSLDFYPPDSATDFRAYFWAESIPPGVAALHAWAYACAGSSTPAWTIPGTILQLWSLHQLGWLIVERSGGKPAAQLACLALAACPLLTWSASISQETGLTAMALAGIFYAVGEWQRIRHARWAILAGIFAAVGASAREYGLIFPLFATVWLFFTNPNRAAWVGFLAAASLSLVWPVRTYLLTGNPFYSLPLAGLPTNTRFEAWLDFQAEIFGSQLATSGGWSDVARYLFLYAPTSILGWLAIAVGMKSRTQPAPRRDGGAVPPPRGMMRTHAVPAAFAVICFAGLWAASVPYTNGGLFYSTRVLSPALVIGALAAGMVLARARESSRALVATAAIVMFALTLPSTLALPANPLRAAPAEWPLFRPPIRFDADVRDDVVALVLQQDDQGPIAADAPGFQRRFVPVGMEAIPLWSPELDWLFDHSLTPAEAVERWQRSGIKHVILTRWETHLRFFELMAQTSRPTAHFRLRLVGVTELNAVFAIEPAR